MTEHIEAMKIAADAVRRESIYRTFLAASIGPRSGLKLDDPLNKALTDDAWADGMSKGFENSKFARMVEISIEVARKDFESRDPVNALAFELNSRFPDEHPMAIAIKRAYDYLMADGKEPRWEALTLFCMGRMVAVNANTSYDKNEWTEVTMLFFQLEKAFLEDDGSAFASNMMKANRHFGGKLGELVGSRMLHGLAEAAINATDSTLFLRPQ